MYDRIKKLTPQIRTDFGGIYVREQHSDAAERHLPPSDIGKMVETLRASMLYEMIKSLRVVLYLRRQR